jgi:hypothetical protein
MGLEQSEETVLRHSANAAIPDLQRRRRYPAGHRLQAKTVAEANSGK